MANLLEEKEEAVKIKQKYLEHHHHEINIKQKIEYKDIESNIKKW